MRNSIVPEIIAINKIHFLDSRNSEISLCPPATIITSPTFQKPFLKIDLYAKKPEREEIIVQIDYDELRKLGYLVIAMKIRRGWFRAQKSIYKLEKISEATPGSKRLKYIPSNHRIEMDKANNRIRVIGLNAGYPHYLGRDGGHGPWVEL